MSRSHNALVNFAVYFWGGFGDRVDCAGVPTYGGGAFVAPPFYVPNPDTNVVTMWTMTQRAGSTTYHIFTAGTSLLVLALMVVLCEMGTVAPAWWGPRARKLGLALGGIHTTSSPSTTSGHGSEKLRLRWHVLEVFGENALAVYVLSDGIGDRIGDMLLDDAPAWYFVLWGEGLYIGSE